MPAPYSHAIFDLDGTLTDSEPGITAGVRAALEQLGRPTPSPADLRRHIGPPLEWSFREIDGLDAPSAARARDLFREYYVERGWAENRTFDGIGEMLTALRGLGVPMAIATAKYEPLARRIVDHFDLTHFFVDVCGAGLDESSARKKAIVARALAALGARPGQADVVVIGDTLHDIGAARDNGLDSIAVSWGYGSSAEIAQATGRVSAPSEIVPIFADQCRANSFSAISSSSTPIPGPVGTCTNPPS